MVKRGSLGSKPRDIATSDHGRVGRRPATDTILLHSLATSGELEFFGCPSWLAAMLAWHSSKLDIGKIFRGQER